MSHERKSVHEMTQEELRAQTLVMRYARFIAPIIALVIGAIIYFLFPQNEGIIFTVTIFIFVSMLVMFSWIYAMSKKALRDRYDERV